MDWVNLGKTQDLATEIQSLNGLKEITLNNRQYVLIHNNSNFSLLNNRCNHMGGPLSRGKLKGNCIECPWHYWQYNCQTGEALTKSVEPLAHQGGTVPTVPLKIEGDSLFANPADESKRIHPAFNPKLPVARDPIREPGKIRVLGISTTAMSKEHPRYSTSEDLLQFALKKSNQLLDVETRFLALADLNFRNCEGFYSKSENACTWPCSITKMDPKDEMVQVYENLVHWADVVIVATPIRWGNASSLYYKMVERLNSVQNQITVKNRILIKNKVASFIVTGGQDNIQSVAGQMLAFFTELGFVSPPFSFVAHSLGWSAEKMEKNMDAVKNNEDLHDQCYQLIERSISMARNILPKESF